MHLIATTAMLTLLGAPLAAQQVSPCDWQASAQNQVEPWEANTRTFANGAVRLTLLDTIEPAAGAYHLMILTPPRDELGGRQCYVVSLGNGFGYANIGFDALTAAYDPATGLRFTLPVAILSGDSGSPVPATLRVTVNQASGTVTPVLLQ